jgi:hypothetical protein
MKGKMGLNTWAKAFSRSQHVSLQQINQKFLLKEKFPEKWKEIRQEGNWKITFYHYLARLFFGP